jgi:hypothetical protein
MLLFGPATITIGGVDLGDTHGGVSVSFDLIDTKDLTEDNVICVGGSGSVSLYRFNGKTVTQSDTEVGNGEMVFSSVNYTLTLYNAKVFVPNSLSLGTFNQQPVSLTFKFRPNTSGNVFKME